MRYAIMLGALGLLVVPLAGCELPTAVEVRAPCSLRTVNYWNLNGQLDSTLTVVDTLGCPR